MFLLERPVCDVEIGEANSDEDEQNEEEVWPEAAALFPADEPLCIIHTAVVALAVVSCVGRLTTESQRLNCCI